jgi:hypothetical protein
MKRISLKLPKTKESEKLHKELKKIALEEDVALEQLVYKLLNNKLNI